MSFFIFTTDARFPLGDVVMTANAHGRIDPATVRSALIRHVSGDWGMVCKDDAALNDEALQAGDRILSVYGEGDGRFWIITEGDRSVTTVLMPEDY